MFLKQPSLRNPVENIKNPEYFPKSMNKYVFITLYIKILGVHKNLLSPEQFATFACCGFLYTINMMSKLMLQGICVRNSEKICSTRPNCLLNKKTGVRGLFLPNLLVFSPCPRIISILVPKIFGKN